MSKKEPVPNPRYTDEFKIEAVRLAASVGGNPAAKRLGIPQSTVTNWVQRSKARTLGEPDATPERLPGAALAEPPREFRRLRSVSHAARAYSVNCLLGELSIVGRCPQSLTRVEVREPR